MGDSELYPFDIRDITGATCQSLSGGQGFDGHRGRVSVLMGGLSLAGISFFVEKHTLIFGSEGT